MKKSISKFIEIITKFWSVIIVLSIILGLISNLRNINKKEKELIYEILDNESIIDLKEKIPNLEILFENSNLEKDSLDIGVIKVKIINSGDLNIIEDDFSNKIDFGLEIDKSVKIIGGDIIYSNSEFLKNYFELSITNNEIHFPKIQFDKDKYVIIKFFVLHKNNTTVSIRPQGKLSGKEKIRIIDVSSEKQTQMRFKNDIINITFYNHLLRFLFYFILVLISFIIVKFIKVLYSFLKAQYINNKLFNAYIESLNKEKGKLDNYERQIRRCFLKGGLVVLEKFIKLNNNPVLISKIKNNNNGIKAELVAIKLTESIKEADKDRAIEFTKSLIIFLTL